MPDEVVAELASRGDSTGLIELEGADLGRRLYKVGEKVRIKDGPLAGFVAVVAARDKGRAVQAWVQSFGGQVRAEFEAESLEPVA